MSQKYHINSKGIPSPCRAAKGNCPYGGDDGQQNHFDSYSEAYDYVSRENESKHGIISGINQVHEEPYVVETENGHLIREGDSMYVHTNGDEDDLFEDDVDLMEHIRENYYGGEAHPETLSEEVKEVTVTKEMLRKQDVPYKNNYHGNEYSISKKAASKLSVTAINESNVREIFDSSFDNGGYSIDYNADSFNNTPVELNARIKKTGDNEYHIRGEIHESSMIESDFDSPEEYNDYLSAGPDMTYDVDYKFSGEELRDTLSEGGRYPNEGANSGDSVGAISSGIYDLSRNNME